MWEKPRIDGKKKVESNAIPTIFGHKVKKNNMTALPVIHDNGIGTDSSNNEICTSATLEELPTCDSLTNFKNKEMEKLLPIINVTNLEEAVLKLQNTLLEAEQAKEEARRTELKFKDANVMIFKINKSKMSLKNHVRKLMDQNKKLTEQIRALKANKNLSKILNDDQIVAFNRHAQGCRWSKNTIMKALRLKMW
ncbi:PREDICTED: uncharacterized protein LOC105570886 [Vollenhovia emeryi]|uniref:uncharacterized protein LOC105570886 n=1 Tax=Vollenhovia emeryi TaxID=411798 RepID=UPI0005F55D65|nr:PREDICTED: uncharacterized protein LOC105570886 [Vollenhovia emeryi]